MCAALQNITFNLQLRDGDVNIKGRKIEIHGQSINKLQSANGRVQLPSFLPAVSASDSSDPATRLPAGSFRQLRLSLLLPTARLQPDSKLLDILLSQRTKQKGFEDASPPTYVINTQNKSFQVDECV